MSDQSVLQSFCIVFTFQIGLLIVNKDGSMQFEDISFQTNGNFLKIFSTSCKFWPRSNILFQSIETIDTKGHLLHFYKWRQGRASG